METEVLATLLGVALAALVAACGAGFRWLRSDLRDLRSDVNSRFEDQATATNAQFAEVNGRLGRLEAKFDELIMALARAGSLIDQQPATPPPLAPQSGTADQPSADQPFRPPPADPLGPTAAPA